MASSRNDRIVAFSPEAYEELLLRITTLESSYKDSPGPESSRFQGKFLRRAITVNPEVGSYPTGIEDNTFPIKLANIEFDPNEQGKQLDVATVYVGAEERIAHSLDNTYIPINTEVMVCRMHRQYYIMPETRVLKVIATTEGAACSGTGASKVCSLFSAEIYTRNPDGSQTGTGVSIKIWNDFDDIVEIGQELEVVTEPNNETDYYKILVFYC